MSALMPSEELLRIERQKRATRPELYRGLAGVDERPESHAGLIFDLGAAVNAMRIVRDMGQARCKAELAEITGRIHIDVARGLLGDDTGQALDAIVAEQGVMLAQRSALSGPMPPD